MIGTRAFVFDVDYIIFDKLFSERKKIFYKKSVYIKIAWSKMGLSVHGK